jgi:hypothetical protein
MTVHPVVETLLGSCSQEFGTRKVFGKFHLLFWRHLVTSSASSYAKLWTHRGSQDPLSLWYPRVEGLTDTPTTKLQVRWS